MWSIEIKSPTVEVRLVEFLPHHEARSPDAVLFLWVFMFHLHKGNALLGNKGKALLNNTCMEHVGFLRFGTGSR